MIYKLTFTTKEQWDSAKVTFLLPDEEGNYPSSRTFTGQTAQGSITCVEVGNIPVAATYDEEGEILTQATFREDYAVDILSDYELPVEEYEVGETPNTWYHNFN